MGILCVVVTLLVNIGSASRPIRGAPATVSQLSDLPLDAQFAVSGLLGRESSAYHIQTSERTLRSINPRQNFVTEWDASGLLLSDGQNRLHLQLTAYGYENNTYALTPSTLQASENRVEYLYILPGGETTRQLTEWYINGPLGIQQGFTLHTPPFLKTAGAPLKLVLELSGDMHAEVAQDLHSLTLLGAQEQPLFYYRNLKVTDAAGRELQAWLRAGESVNGPSSSPKTKTTFSIQINDQGARYPLTIDPFVQRAKLTSSDGRGGDHFGDSVANSNNTIVVGAPYSDIGGNDAQGAAYVFVKPASGWTNMTQTAKLSASAGAAVDAFGSAVAIDGDTIVIGAPSLGLGSGSAFVFLKPSAGWENATETAKLTASDGLYMDYFGCSVSVKEDTIVVGAWGNDSPSAIDVGAAYIFVKPMSGWANTTETAKLLPSDSASGDHFGIAVATDGDTVVVGANRDEDWKGSAYVFLKPVAGWSSETETAKLTASDGAADDQFGNSVAINSSTIVIGADSDDIDGNSGQGSAYVFVKPGTGWASGSETAKLTATGWEVEGFGESVVIKDATIIVGAPATWGCSSCPSVGAAYVFVKPDGGWISMTETSKIMASDGAQLDMFGGSVGYSDSVLVVGAGWTDIGKKLNQGSAYVFPLMPQKPKLAYPSKGTTFPQRKVPLNWGDTESTETYKVIVREGSKTGTVRLNLQGLKASDYLTPKLQRGKTYYWRIGACNDNGCTNSPWWYFTIKP